MAIPDFLTVPEAAKVLRLGRTAAYELASRFEATAGAEGLPVIRLGRQLRVPRAQLELLAGGPLSDLVELRTPPASDATGAAAVAVSPARLRPVPSVDTDQAALPFGR
jgi:excisionase family DNA binding protein